MLASLLLLEVDCSWKLSDELLLTPSFFPSTATVSGSGNREFLLLSPSSFCYLKQQTASTLSLSFLLYVFLLLALEVAITQALSELILIDPL